MARDTVYPKPLAGPDKWSAFQANIMAKQNDEYHAAIRNVMASLSLFQNE